MEGRLQTRTVRDIRKLVNYSNRAPRPSVICTVMTFGAQMYACLCMPKRLLVSSVSLNESSPMCSTSIGASAASYTILTYKSQARVGSYICRHLRDKVPSLSSGDKAENVYHFCRVVTSGRLCRKGQKFNGHQPPRILISGVEVARFAPTWTVTVGVGEETGNMRSMW